MVGRKMTCKPNELFTRGVIHRSQNTFPALAFPRGKVARPQGVTDEGHPWITGLLRKSVASDRMLPAPNVSKWPRKRL